MLPVAFNWSQGGNATADGYGSTTNISMAALTLVIVLALRKLLRGFLQQIAILLGLVAGTLIAIPVGITDFGAIKDADLIGFPTPFHFGAPQFEIAAIVSMCVVMLVCMTESTADMLALGKIVGRPADERTIEGGLRADTLGSAVSPLFNGFMCSAFAQNIGLVAMTKVRSRFVVAAGGASSSCSAWSRSARPSSRSCHCRCSAVRASCSSARSPRAASRSPAGAALEKGENALIVAAALGIGLIPIAAPEFYHAFPKDLLVVLDSGISTGCVVAIVLNLAFNHLGRKPEPVAEEPSSAEAAAPVAAH